MYSVEDLLISHGYKLPKHSTPTPGHPTRPAPSASPPSPPSYSRHQQLLDRPRTVNGFYNCSISSSQARDRSQSRQDTLLGDAGFCDSANHCLQLQSKDVSYWRRKGQDFAVLLDYTDYKEAAGGRQGSYAKPERPEEARGQEPAEEHPTAERQQWMGQARCRESEQLLAWRTAERKCQSLGAEEWHPAGEHCTQEQRRLHTRTPEGMLHLRTKAKTQSLPRMQPNSLQYVDRGSGQELFKRVNGHPLFHPSIYRAPRWPDGGRPASANQLSITPKPRFTRPPRPPSYEMHQQIRGSCEGLSGRDFTRDRTPLSMLRTAESQLDYFAQDSGPPGYIPPPSYKRAPIMEGGCREYGEVAFKYGYRGDVYQQLHRAPDGSHWFPKHAGVPSTMSHPRQLYPVYMTQDRPGGRIQYIPFDHSQISNISSALGGNSLTDADKIRHIRKELPSLTVSKPASGNSAFLPPPLGPSLVGKLASDSNPTYREFDNDNNRWHSNLHKETVDNIPATDQNCNNRYHKIQRSRPTSPFSAFHAPKTSPGLRCNSEQGFLETITQVKQIRPDLGPDNNRNTKRRVSETIFCLVSVPVHTPTNFNKNAPADQNNNDTTTSLTIPDTFAVGLKESRPVRSRSVNQVPIWGHYSHFDTSGTSSLRNYKRAPLRKEIIDAWALQANENRELYSRSWPGNQYRNQETQTGSPLPVIKSPEPQVFEEKTTQPVSHTSTDSTSANGFCMEGQKNLHISSKSAFSLLSPTQGPSEEASPPVPASPSTDPNKGKQPVSSPTHSPPDHSADSTEQVRFGQFLLKPVERRPCDAISELESINKEMEDTICKRANVSLCRGRKKHHLHLSGVQSVEEIQVETPSNIKVRSKSFTSTADLDTVGMSSSFLRPKKDSLQSTQEHTGSTQDSEPTHQDIPVPQESLLRDVGLTVYTEMGPREQVQRSSSVPPLQQFEELSWDSRISTANMSRGSVEHRSNKELKAKTNHKQHSSGVSLRICRSRSESSRSSHKRECSPHVIKLNREVSCLCDHEDLNSRYMTCTDDSSVADKTPENLITQEKTKCLPAEDLSNLYEVKCAEGIPENESIEERAARILGIAVPVGVLCVVDKHKQNNQASAEVKQEVSESQVQEEEKNRAKEPNKCLLSLPTVWDHQLANTMCSERMTQQVLETLSSSAGISPDRPTETDGREVYSLKDNQSKESELLEGAKMGNVHDLCTDEKNLCEKDTTHETQDKKPAGVCASEEVEVCDYKQRMELEEEILIALTENKKMKEASELRTEDPGEVELKVVEGSQAKCAESRATGGGHSWAESATPKPKQRTKLQKPALLPKPRSVPKREISLPPRSTTSMEDQDRSAVPDIYDPSRVERV